LLQVEGSLENDPGSFRTEIRFACYQQAETEENTEFRMDWPRVNFIDPLKKASATDEENNIFLLSTSDPKNCGNSTSRNASAANRDQSYKTFLSTNIN
jgi:hypothetical protein